MQTQITQRSKSIIFILFTAALLFSSEALAQTEIFGFGGYMTYSSVAVREGDRLSITKTSKEIEKGLA